MGRECEGTFRPFVFHCIAGLNNLGILYDGKLASCSNIPRDFVEGDLRTDSIRDVWETRYQRYRSFGWKRIGSCSACAEWKYCHGGPMHKRTPEGQMMGCLYNHLKEPGCKAGAIRNN
jgi:radical SAM protein with 4Fe4S-binding SPASM domain